jgi:hypothetical protein
MGDRIHREKREKLKIEETRNGRKDVDGRRRETTVKDTKDYRK